jgi:hypothetical protein
VVVVLWHVNDWLDEEIEVYIQDSQHTLDATFRPKPGVSAKPAPTWR